MSKLEGTVGQSPSLNSIKILPGPGNQYRDCPIKKLNGQFRVEKKKKMRESRRITSDVRYCEPEVNFLFLF